MKTITRCAAVAAWLACWAAVAGAQPLAKPLADFDRMLADLKASSVVAEPIRAGNTNVVPFAAVRFGFGNGGALGGFAGGIGVHTLPLGVVIVEGDEVRVELLAQEEGKPVSMLQQLIQGIIDRKVVIMGNGVNLGNAPGNVSDLTAMITGMMGQTTVIGNALNLGYLRAPVADLEAAAQKNPTAENYFNLGEAFRKNGQKEKAAAAYQKAIELRPGYPEAVRALAGLKQ
jgi:uncharacterized spore protein YtfJ